MRTDTMTVRTIKMNLTIPVSARQFAKMVGVASDNAVRKAVERGSIVRGYDPKTKKFIPEIAAMEWGKEILPEFIDAKPKSPPLKNPPKKKAASAQTTRPATGFPTNPADFEKEVFSEPIPEATEEEIEEFESSSRPFTDMSPKYEAERRLAVFKAKMAEVLYNEKKANLIPREKISGILFGFGQEMRVSFEGITNRVLDRILAANDRNEAKRILDEEIYDTLNSIAEIPKRTIT